MSALTIRVPFPPAVLLTLVATTLLLYSAYLIAPDSVRVALLVCAGLMVAVVAFTSVELTLYLLILSTLLSPELQFGGSTDPTGPTTASRGVTLRLDDLLLTVICLTWLFRMAVSKELGVVRQTPINQPIAWYLLATFLATIAGFYTGRVGMYGFFFVLKYLEYFVLFYMIINQIHDEAAIKRYIMVMLFTCFVVSILGIAQIPGGERVSAPFEGDIGEPNTFGGYLVLMFAVTLGLFLSEVDKMKRWRWAGLLVIIVVPLAFTESRSSYLAFMVMIGLFIMLSQHKRLLIGSCMVAATLLPFVLPGNVISRVTYTFAQPEEAGQINVGGVHLDTSTSERLRSWELVLTKDLPRHPLLGVGVTGSRFMDAQYPRVLSETGIVGLILFLWLLRRIWVLLRVCHRSLSDTSLRGVALGTLCGFGGLLFHALGSNSFIIVRIMEPLMILVGLLLAALLIEQQKTSDGLQNGDFV
ncbi:MAG: O-antigen ligase family protein [Mariprofundaceae bacterium]|nr:O-antigen ligase family protein [Mariprofundaceae bacterium]